MKKILAMVVVAAMSLGIATSSFAMPQTKKDGTADKRYKANKTPKGPTKKDGTADKRFKANKPAPKPAPKKTK